MRMPLEWLRSVLGRGRSPESGESDGRTAGSRGADGRERGSVAEPTSTEAEIRRLLDANGGRLKQQRIVDETGLSDASVSRYLASLERAGDVKRVKRGRENVVVLLTGTDTRKRSRRCGDGRGGDGR